MPPFSCETRRLQRRPWPAPVLLFSLLIISGKPAVADARSVSAVDSYIRHEMTERHIPGLALAVIRHGKLEKLSYYGFANLEFSVPVTRTTRFQVASISKEFTSVALMTLVEQGKVRLEDHLGDYLGNLPEAWRTVTIREALSETSGLPDVVGGNSEALADNPQDALRVLREHPMDFIPGSKWAYNQTNYLLLALLVERITGERFETYCQEHLFAPFHLGSPTWGLQVVLKDRATIYTDLVPGSYPPKTLDHLETSSGTMPPMLYSAGGLNISIDDFARWLVALLDGKLISKQSLEQLWTAARLNDGGTFDSYGLGWWLERKADHPQVGGNGGARAAFAIYLNDDLAVIVLTNLLGSDAPTLVDGVARKYFQVQNRQNAGP